MLAIRIAYYIYRQNPILDLQAVFFKKKKNNLNATFESASVEIKTSNYPARQ